jgi:cardiolipin synthase
MNRRNHRKLVLIDGVAWVGSFNITADHCSVKWKGRGWRDTGIKVAGPPVELIAASFEQVWQRRFSKLPQNPWLRLNLTRLMRWQANSDLRRRIRTARTRIWITSAYFVPRTRIAVALAAAARRGVDVRILVPAVSDIFFAPRVARLYSVLLCRAGVHFLEYSPTVLHAKSAIIDDWSFVGSSNFNHRSVIHDLELDVVLSSPESKKRLAEQFLIDSSRSVETQGHDANRGIIGFIARLLWRIRWYA